MISKTVSEVAFRKKNKCINFNDEFRCPCCNKLLVPICVNLGAVKEDGEKIVLYCSRSFPVDCSEYGCPKYNYISWLEQYRMTGLI